MRGALSSAENPEACRDDRPEHFLFSARLLEVLARAKPRELSPVFARPPSSTD